MRFHSLPRWQLRTILLLVHLLVLVIPIGSIYTFRIYENELLRQTESELIAQGAYVASIYKHTLLNSLPPDQLYGTRLTDLPPRADERYTPIQPALSFATTHIHPPRAEAKAGHPPASPYALKAAETITPILEEALLTTLAGLRVTDEHGTILIGHDETGLSIADVPETAEAMKGRYAASIRQRISDQPDPSVTSISRAAGIRVFVAIPVMDGDHLLGTVLLSRSPRNLVKALYDNRLMVAVAGGMILGITILLALLTSHFISRPIHALMEQTRRVAAGEKHIPPIASPATQEFAMLSQQISVMADTIASRSDYIRNFAMHVSHEFKTPLTAIQGAIELIQEHGNTMPKAQFRKFLANIVKDTDRLKILVTRLLELARADVMETTEGNACLQTVITGLQSDSQDKGIALTLSGDTELTLPMPGDIARSIFGSLIDNSIQHGARTMTVTAKREVSGYSLRFQDDGKGISATNAGKLFTPFFTTRREHGGTGLGLVIIRAMLNAHHADIRLDAADKGACFTIYSSDVA